MNPDLVLFKATSGAQSALLRWPSGRTQLLHSAIDPEKEASDIVMPEIWGDVILCLGTGLGYHLLPLRQVTRPLTIVLCEAFAPLLEAAAQCLAGTTHRIISVLCPQSVVPSFPGAKFQVLRHPASYRISESVLDACAGTILHNSISKEATSASAGKPRTLLLHGRHFLQEELSHALVELNVPSQLMTYEDYPDGGAWESALMRVLQDFRPDMILSVNMKGIDSEGILMDAARRLGISVQVWFVDDPRPIALAYSSRMYPWIQAWCWERAYLPWLRTKGFCSPRWLPLAGDTHIFTALRAGNAEPLDLVFTGSTMGAEYLDRIRRSFLWDDRLANQVDLRSESVLQGQHDPSKLLDGWDLPFQDERNRSWLMCLIQHTASHKKRIRTLEASLGFGLVCAGDPQGWTAIFGDKVRVLDNIDYRKELCAHYQRCVINLNVTSCQMPTAVNQRVFDVPLSGSFLLTDAQMDLSELFGTDDVVVYHSLEDLQEKIRWYLAHAQERERFISRGRALVLRRHTYALRLQEICQFFQTSQASL